MAQGRSEVAVAGERGEHGLQVDEAVADVDQQQSFGRKGAEVAGLRLAGQQVQRDRIR